MTYNIAILFSLIALVEVARSEEDMFLCKNSGFIKYHISTSFIDDGICDCCDGSDEIDSDVKCNNTCKSLQDDFFSQLKKEKLEIESSLWKKKNRIRKTTDRNQDNKSIIKELYAKHAYEKRIAESKRLQYLQVQYEENEKALAQEKNSRFDEKLSKLDKEIDDIAQIVNDDSNVDNTKTFDAPLEPLFSYEEESFFTKVSQPIFQFLRLVSDAKLHYDFSKFSKNVTNHRTIEAKKQYAQAWKTFSRTDSSYLSTVIALQPDMETDFCHQVIKDEFFTFISGKKKYFLKHLSLVSHGNTDGSGFNTELGYFEYGTPKKAIYKNQGTSVEVNHFCGDTDRIISVRTEGIYSIDFETPCACSEERLALITKTLSTPLDELDETNPLVDSFLAKKKLAKNKL